MNRLGSHTIYSLVSSVAIPNECLVRSKVALHQIPRKWQAACRIISNGFPWCLKDVVFGCFSLYAVTEKVPNRGSQERQRRKRTLSCLCLFTLWPDGPLQNHTLLLFHWRKWFLHVVDCWEELNTLRILSPWVFDLCHCFLHDFLRPDWLFATARMRLVHVSAFQEMSEAPYRVSRFNLFA